MSIQFSGTNLACFRGGRSVFSKLSFNLEAGSALLLTGSNGSGKSSLLRIMAGFLTPTTGSVQWHDGPIYDDPEVHYQRLHFVSHHDPIKPVLTARENVEFWANLRGAVDNLHYALRAFDITKLSDIPGRFLSAGQKRRVNLTRLIASPAKLWLLDEPTIMLDSSTVKRFEKLVDQHRENGGMIVVSSHTALSLNSPETLKLDDFHTKENLDEPIY